MKQFKIIKIGKKAKRVINDFVSEEFPLTIEINKKKTATLLCSPYDLKDLALGFSYSLGFIQDISGIKKAVLKKKDKIARLKVNPLNLAAGDGSLMKGARLPYAIGKLRKISRINSDFRMKAGEIIKLMQRFQGRSLEFKKTGGVHSASLCSKKKILIFRDDLGRHNAVDKVIGNALLRNVDFSDKLMLATARISSEILLKTLRCKIPILASVSAPTDEAVKLARRYNLTLIGFVREGRLNVYASDKRIIYG